ncbi:phosphoserine phosphatase SerB [Motilimonas cestriensis]|uniref:phosphoserine phosphatase SerB n=1 Tax=Motilimonas cestriensis TaxID=2742685 RepID=UPI003DA1CD8F
MQKLREVKVTQLPESLIQWKALLIEQVGAFDALLFEPQGASAVTQVSTLPAKQLVLMGRTLTSPVLSQLSNILLQNKVDGIYAYAPKNILGATVVRLDLVQAPAGTKALVQEFCQTHQLDFAFVDHIPNLAEPGVVLMDMDSTTIQIECIDEIARLYGVGEQVSAVTAQAMNGKLDFNESLRSRVALLEGADESILNQVIDNMPLMPGLEGLIAGLKQAGWKVCIASGGFTYFAQALKDNLGFDQVFANTLEIVDGKLTGKVLGEIVNAQVKARVLGELAQQYGVSHTQTVAIGDGANDLVMMAASAMGVAIHAKPVVQEQAAVSINHLDLEAALCILSTSQSTAWS